MEAEADYAICRAVKALHELYQAGEFTESARSTECVEKARRSSDSVKAFLDEKICIREGIRIDKSRMYELYEEYCRENGRQPLGKARFISEMERKGHVAAKYCGIFKYKNLAVQEEDFHPADEEIPF